MGDSQPEAENALIDAMLEALPAEIAIIDRTGAIVQTNEAWTKAARGAPVSDGTALSVGANYLNACRARIGMPADTAQKICVALESILRGRSQDFTLEYPSSRGGEDRWLEVHIRGLAHLAGGAAVMHFDITARRHAEAAARRHLGQMAHLDRVAGMGQLTSSIAHELNQPLTAIISNAQAATRLAADAAADPTELRACLADIVSDGQRAAQVIRRMRRLLKKADVASLPLALNDLVASTIGLVTNDALLHGVSIGFTPGPTLPVVNGDLVQIQQVLLNVLTNAITAAAAGPSSVRRVSVWTTLAAAPYVEIGVHDSGRGIAVVDMERLFEPFFTTKAEGLGLGLAISRAIVEAHGGHFAVENDLAGGATFRVRLRTDRPQTA
jgi:C4-dicarboxylate-specific signal transduction histidine kinase